MTPAMHKILETMLLRSLFCCFFPAMAAIAAVTVTVTVTVTVSDGVLQGIWKNT